MHRYKIPPNCVVEVSERVGDGVLCNGGTFTYTMSKNVDMMMTTVKEFNRIYILNASKITAFMIKKG